MSGDAFNAFITPEGKLLKFGSPHDVFAKTRFKTKVPELLKDGYVRVSWYIFNDVHPLIDTHDLKAALPAIQKALLPFYERLGNIPVTAYEKVRRSDKKDDHIIDTDLATLTLGTFRDIRDKTPFGERDNPQKRSKEISVDIVEAATEAREELEHSCANDSYASPDNRTVKNHCYDGSLLLYDKLQALGYDPVIVGGYFVLNGEEIDHTWIDIKGKILDITADQFGDFPPVWIDAEKKYYRDRHHSFYADNPMKKTIPVDVQDVIDNLEDTDGTGDPSWFAELSKTVEKLGRNWLLGPVKIRTIQNDNTSDADDLLDGYADGIENAPPVVLVPSKNTAYKWYVTDGAHRTATLELLGKKTVMAYYPELDE